MKMPAPASAQIEQLFACMDQAYRQAAGAAGFACRGCEQNCCRTLFHHHTLAEYLYLKTGLARMPDAVQDGIVRRAAAALERVHSTGEGGRPPPLMCPLNEQGRCVLYAHRPMICRLHGLPHLLRRPDGKTQTGPGCDDYYRQCGTVPNESLDRTPHYTAMARLEKGLRRQLGFDGRIRMTIAQMVMGELLEESSGRPG
jgi:Fe-S-cluster containining protein